MNVSASFAVISPEDGGGAVAGGLVAGGAAVVGAAVAGGAVVGAAFVGESGVCGFALVTTGPAEVAGAAVVTGAAVSGGVLDSLVTGNGEVTRVEPPTCEVAVSSPLD